MNYNNTNFKVDKGFYDSIQDMKRKQDEIPEYYPQLIELGDLTTQSKFELMTKMKNNLKEIEKAEDVDESKGRIAHCGYTAFARKEKYVFPAFDYIFDLDGLSTQINELVTNGCNEFFDEQMEENEFYSRYSFPVSKYIRFIRDFRQHLLWVIKDVSDIRNLHLVVSFNFKDLAECYQKNTEKKYYIPEYVNLYIQEDEKINVVRFGTFSRIHEEFDNPLKASSYWAIKGLNTNRYKLSEWKNGLLESKQTYIKGIMREPKMFKGGN